MSESRQLFQGIRCGALNVAFPYGWATSIVDDFELTPVPRAPAWLIGASNIDGRIIPVVDLGRYRRSNVAVSNANDQRKRLLIGALNVAQGDGRLAIAFNGLPQQLETTLEPTLAPSTTLISGFIQAANGERFARVNVDRLMDDLVDALEAS